jgi:dTDP-4-dehydrorhamnose reductase
VLKVLITGANGQLARALCKQVSANVEIHAVTHVQLDIADAPAVEDHVLQLQPDVIINAAAYTAVDKAESEPERAAAVNVMGTRNLALAASKLDRSRMIHMSTDFVFDGKVSRAYAVDSECKPLNVYGRTKRESEIIAIKTLGSRALIVRTSWLYDVTGKNFVMTMLRLMKERDAVRVVADQIGTPTSTRSLAEMLWRCVTQSDTSGIYHWSDAGVASWYDFAIAIAEEARDLGILERDVKVIPITTSDYPTPAKRPAFSVLDKLKTYADLNITPVHWREQLRMVLGELVHG